MSIVLATAVYFLYQSSCSGGGLIQAILAFWFPAIALVPALVFLFTSNPLRSIGSALAAVLLYSFAFYVNCTRNDPASASTMTWIVTIIYGTPLAALLGLATGPLTRVMNIHIKEETNRSSMTSKSR